MPANFVLQFDPSEIGGRSERFGFADDTHARAAGRAILDGDYSVRNVRVIVEWKSRRSKGRFGRNAESDVADALRLAVSAKTERSAIAVLCGLRGIKVPVASAIMAAVVPERFTIIDFRALEALGIKRRHAPTVDFYLDYLAYCRQLAPKNAGGLRELDRALWQWSESRGEAL